MIKIKYMKKILFLVMTFSACLLSCNRVDVLTEAANGTLSVKVADITDYITVETKSSGIDYGDLSNYDVVIDGPTKKTGKYGEMFNGQIVELGSGKYSITVTSPATEPAAFEQPIYQAYEEFQIIAGEVTDLSLTCTPYNCMVTFELTENFIKELASYEVSVTNGLGVLTWVKNATTNDFDVNNPKAGYFLARGLEVKVKGYRSIDNTEATAVYYVKNPQPAEHHIIKLDAKVTGTISGITISVVSTFNEVIDDIYVDGMGESYIDRPDFGDGDDEEVIDMNPTISWDGNTYFDPVTVVETSAVRMVINAPAGIKSFRVNVSDNFKAALGMMTNTNLAELVPKVDENGQPILKEKKDGAGNIIYQEKLDEEGNVMRDEEGNVIYETDENGERIPVMVQDMEIVPILDEAGKKIPLVGVDYIDLIEHAFIWYPLNLPVAGEVKDQTQIVFELTPFIPTLCQAASDMTVQFMLEAYDNNDVKVRWTDISGEKYDPVVTMGVKCEPRLD
jgi:hypothetical protein